MPLGRNDIIIAALIILAILMVFYPVINFDFVDYDDGVNIYKNPHLNPPSIGNTIQFWQKPYEHLYIPFTYTVWSLAAALSATADMQVKISPYVFHTMNLIFHILSSLMVYLILRTLILKISISPDYKRLQNLEVVNWSAFIGALLFGLHPLQVEPVAWVTGLKDILCGFLSFVAIWQYLKYASNSASKTDPGSTMTIKHTKTNKSKTKKDNAAKENSGSPDEGRDNHKISLHYSFACAAYVLALLSKPTAVVVPLILWILDYSIMKRTVKESAKVLSGWIALAVPLFIVTKLSQSDEAISFIPPIWSRPLIASDTMTFYLYKLFMPITVGSYAYCRTPESIMQHGWFFASWVVPAGIAALLWVYKERISAISVSIFIAGFIPVSGLVPFLAQNFSTVSDRYLYISMLGPAIAASWFVASHWSRHLIIASSIILAILGIRSVFQVPYWQNSKTLFSHALQLNPDNFVAHYNLAGALRDMGKIDEAIFHFSESKRLKPDYADTSNNLANLLLLKGKPDDAVALYSDALKYKPDNAVAHFNLALALAKEGKIDKAIEHYHAAIKIEPESPLYRNNLGNVLISVKRYDDAISQFAESIRLKPDYAEAHYNMGNVFVNLERYDQAISHYKDAIRIKPDFAEAHNNLGGTYARLKRWDEAIKEWNEALDLDPNNQTAKGNRDAVMKMLGKQP